VYTSLDYESRFVGKEIIGLFANRFGKSFMAVTLFLLSAWYDDSTMLIRHLVIALVAIDLVWVGVSLRLNNLIKASEQTIKRD
jgi:ATP/ADP translocase